MTRLVLDHALAIHGKDLALDRHQKCLQLVRVANPKAHQSTEILHSNENENTNTATTKNNSK